MSFTLEIFLVSERVSKTCIPIAAKFDGNWIPNLVHLCLSINKLIRSAAKFDGNWILNLSLTCIPTGGSKQSQKFPMFMPHPFFLY